MAEITFPEIEEQPVSWGYYRDLHDAGRYKAIVDRDTGKLFSIVSKDYKVIRHEQAIDALEDILYNTKGLGAPSVTTSFYNDGGRMRRTYRFKGISVDISQDDKIQPELHLFNSYDLTWPLIVLLGAFRFVCANGLVVGRKFYQLRKRHVVQLEQMDFRGQVTTALERFKKQVKTWRKWEKRALSLDTYQKVMEAMKFGKRATETIEDMVSEEVEGFLTDGYPRPTVWTFYNLLTWFVTHETVSLNHRVELENRLRRAVEHFGK
ncbi:MAG: DUF932 domain-containing protein [Deltaproteobacteria bacterium]|nr:DUF932 domain-containing protein [Deltaproteobacteria bacterium]